MYSLQLYFSSYFIHCSALQCSTGQKAVSQPKKAEEAKLTLDSAKNAALSGAKTREDSAVIDRGFVIAVQPYLKTLESETESDTAGTTDAFKEKYMKKKEKREKKTKSTV